MSKQQNVKLNIGNMTCINCQYKIEKQLKHLRGVISADVSYSKGSADITYNSEIIKIKQIEDSIEKLGYEVVSGNGTLGEGLTKTIIPLASILVLYMVLQHTGLLNRMAPSELADNNMSYFALFVIGLITSVHCVAMCGGINLSQSLKQDEKNLLFPAMAYNLGRVVSYTACGFVLDGLGYLIGAGTELGIPYILQGILKIIAGVFMVVMGINLLDMFPGFRRLSLRIPKPIARFIIRQKSKTKVPFVVGFLNGFMPCGPLQSMWIVALAAANPFVGAFSMLAFAIGTVPLMLGLGAIVSMLGNKFMKTTMKVGGVLVTVLGLAMLSQGVLLSNMNVPSSEVESTVAENEITEEKTESSDANVQLITSELELGRYPDITVEANQPVKWTINVPEGTLTGCNSTMIIPEYGIEHTFNYGENVIEFTPESTGDFTYTCWMGMVTGNISVVD